MMEMQQMINWELKRAETQAKQEEQLALRKRQEEAMEKEKVRRIREAEEARRQRELEKMQRQQEEMAASRALAQRDYAEAKKRKEMEERAKAAWKQEMIQRERERAQKAEEHRQQTQSILQELEAQAAKRMEEMARRDEARKEKLERRRMEQRAEMMEKTMKNKQRIMTVNQDKERLAQMQWEEYAQRQAESEMRRLRLEEEQAAKREEQARYEAERRAAEQEIREHQKFLEAERRERLLEAERDAEIRLQLRNEEKAAIRLQKIQEDQERDRARRQVVDRMKETQEERLSQILTKSQAKAERTNMMKMKKRMDMRSKWEDAKLRAEAIQEALQRKARREEYHKSLLMTKLEADKARTDAIKNQKDSILKQRKIVKQKADLQRKEILNSFNKLKMAKKLNIDAVESVLGSIARPKSATNSPPKSVTKPGRPRTAPKSNRRPKTPIKKPSASVVCRQRYISKHISRYPTEKVTIESGSQDEIAPPATLTVEEQLEALRRRQNQELLRVLEEEQAAEEQREVILRQARDGAERNRLEKIFGLERSQASERIMRLTEEHEVMFNQRVAELKGVNKDM
ncbi:hypothetical protein Ae201684_003208 [Aphanomyces euteiches]|uniref:Uncharacterized protein n=1 Tax=Aphanomyces euteiches TaxID=100861 RepID=A0A6G0XMB5_9STRA|nr:hypothetical protein Ae201684_003208 [Aphanomyces euteiches]